MYDQIDFWTPQQIAEALNITPQFIVQIIKGKFSEQGLQATKIAGRWLIRSEEAHKFIEEYKKKTTEFYSPNDLAKAIGKSRKYILDALTGYGGRKEPRLAGEKRGERWCIGKIEAERFIEEHEGKKQ